MAGDEQAEIKYCRNFTPNGRAKEIKCSACGRHFTRRYHLKRHMDTTSCSNHAHPSFCEEVETGTKSPEVTVRVKQDTTLTVVQVRPFSCPDCPKEFNSRGALKKHTVVHTGQRPYKCLHCPLRFSQKGTLNRHVVTHLQVLPFECQHCGKRYAQAGSLKLHLFSHTQENGFTCTVCGRQFARKHTLRLHVQGVHQRKRPHACSTCGKRYARRDDLQVHRNTCGNAESEATERSLSKRSIGLSSLFAEIPSQNAYCTRTTDHGISTVPSGPCVSDTNNYLATLFSSFQEKLKMQCSILTSDSAGTAEELTEAQFTADIEKLLLLLVGEVALKRLGWPNTDTENLLRNVIRSCGRAPAGRGDDTLRENCRLFLGSFLEDDVVRRLSGARGSIDDVVKKILQLKEIW